MTSATGPRAFCRFRGFTIPGLRAVVLPFVVLVGGACQPGGGGGGTPPEVPDVELFRPIAPAVFGSAGPLVGRWRIVEIEFVASDDPSPHPLEYPLAIGGLVEVDVDGAVVGSLLPVVIDLLGGETLTTEFFVNGSDRTTDVLTYIEGRRFAAPSGYQRVDRLGVVAGTIDPDLAEARVIYESGATSQRPLRTAEWALRLERAP
jgi:hypothetical protein